MSNLLYQQDFFERTAERQPDAVAVDDHGATLTYSAIEARANRLAHLLRGLGSGPNQRVCIFTGKNANMYAAVLATLKSGGCWVPLSAAYPHDRLKYLVEILEPKAVIVEADGVAAMQAVRDDLEMDLPLILLGESGEGADLGEADVARQSDARPPREGASPDDLAYIIFTSGSTGTPKGVMVLHRNTAQFLSLCPDLFAIEPGSRFAHFSDLTFDPSVFDLFHCWASGGALVPFNRRQYRINPGLFIRDQRVGVLFTVPSVIASLADSGQIGDPELASLRHLLLTGEALPPRLLRQWYDAYPQSGIYNMYGTTETAIISHCYRIATDYDPATPVPLGRPLPGTRIMLLDGDRPVSRGEVGESVVYGSQLSPGYWANPFQTDAAFVRNPLEPALPQTVYRTGDLLREGEDGLHYYVGRADSQLKVRGHRVELGEIENALMQLDGVRDAAVAAVSLSGGGYDNRLVAFVRGEFGSDTDSLGRHLASRLPNYMVPSRIVPVLEDMPRSQNGKIDRKALQRLAADALARGEPA
jgi:amino acid adenylation domain-containing protein